ncbi:DgyrCDS2738 [Dimorphilus gyrociliatus]|uniref:DgyrCDS2738 n=1 Tax=Dimorphilus gyrociliatus TaxID=2664684 RepID=A0A7I8VB63_9ANNE|nr:DgyrCDS2738 [Dimorphilus gyrociliatus]
MLTLAHQVLRTKSQKCIPIICGYKHYSSNGRFNKELGGDTVRIGCASGFWGDTATSARQLVQKGQINYLVFDYLSEITMSLLTAAKKKDSKFGYAPDFVHFAVGPLLKDIKNSGIKVISNAGGVNPHSCANALEEIAKKNGINLNVAVITGDDLMSKTDELSKENITDMNDSLALPKSLTSMNAYFGAFPIARALDKGADVVITGRCVDSALALGPLVHEYKWNPADLDKLAMGSLAGHLIECGAQSTGGIFTDWQQVEDWHNIGFPIVECSQDGPFVLLKPDKTGGLVSRGTASEQLVYEIGDPQNYILPDVVCDFSQVKIQEIKGSENEAVLVQGAIGKRAPDSYKVCATYMDGYKATAVCCLGGKNSAEKGRKTANAILNRVRNIFKSLKLEDFRRTHVQILGNEDTYGEHANSSLNLREGVVWMSVHHNQKMALEIFSREIAAAGTGMAPGLTAIVGGRPKV